MLLTRLNPPFPSMRPPPPLHVKSGLAGSIFAQLLITLADTPMTPQPHKPLFLWPSGKESGRFCLYSLCFVFGSSFFYSMSLCLTWCVAVSGFCLIFPSDRIFSGCFRTFSWFSCTFRLVFILWFKDGLCSRFFFTSAYPRAHISAIFFPYLSLWLLTFSFSKPSVVFARMRLFYFLAFFKCNFPTCSFFFFNIHLHHQRHLISAFSSIFLSILIFVSCFSIFPFFFFYLHFSNFLLLPR